MLNAELQQALVAEANLAPSVHNTQPTRWSFDDRTITLYVDESRLLKIGDPSGQDAGVSCGGALEGTAIALSRQGMTVTSVEDLWEKRSTGPRPGLRVAARMTVGDGELDALAPFVDQRFTWRGLFEPVAKADVGAFSNWAVDSQHITFVSDRPDIEFIADLNDTMSLGVMRDRPFREELMSYMRLSKQHPEWSVDGLNLDAMQMSAIEGHMAKVALKYPFFEGIDAIGLSRMMVSERDKTLSAAGVAFFSVPLGTPPLEMGRAFYRCWLHFTRLGFVAWPMAVLADDPQAAQNCIERFNVPAGHKLINVFRVGAIDRARRPATARIASTKLIID
jgi:hypothetical protein